MSLLVVAPLAAMLAFQPQMAVQGTTSVTLHHASAAARSALPCAALHARRDLKVGQEWEGLISKITDYGFFCKLGHEGHLGLVHIRTLTPERLPRDEVADWIEEVVGPIGSKVRVSVLSLQHRGQKRTALNLLDVMTRQHMEDLVFAPGPRRMAGVDRDNFPAEDVY